MSQHFDSVWYANQKRIESIIKIIVFNDRGTLDVHSGKINFKGKKHDISMSNIVKVSLSRQRIPWVVYIIINIIFVPTFILQYSDRFNIWYALAVLVLANLAGMLVAISTKWILVEYDDESGQRCKTYLSDGSKLGWGGIFGGTKRLYQILETESSR